MKRKISYHTLQAALFPVLRLNEGEDQGGGDGGGGASPAGGPNTGTNQQGRQSDPVLNPWATVSQNPPNQTQQQPAASSNNGENSPSAQVDQYIAGLDFSNGADLGAMMQAVSDGDSGAFGDQLSKMLAGVYKQAMIDSQRLNRQSASALRDEASAAASASVNLNTALDQLVSEIPAFGDESMQPVLRATLNGFMRQHNGDVRKSVADTKKYMERFVGQIGGAFGFQRTTDDRNRPFSAPRGNPMGETPRDQQPDWKAFLSAVENPQ